MRIESLGKLGQIYQANNIAATNKTRKTSFRDQLEISQMGRDLQVAKQAVASTPEIREDKINEIKSRMEAKNYKINLQDVASKVVDSFYDETR